MNTEQLTITMGTDAVLYDTLRYQDEVFDPNLAAEISVNLVSGLGRRTSLDYEIEGTDLVISVPWVDGRLAGYYGLEVFGMCNGQSWATYADSLIHYTRGTSDGATTVVVDSDTFDVSQEVSYYRYGRTLVRDVTVDGESIVEDGVAALNSDDFGKVDDVRVNGESVVTEKIANIPVPTAVSELENDSSYTTTEEVAQSIADATISDVVISVDDNVGTPEATASLLGHTLSLEFANLKGERGNGIESVTQVTSPTVSGGQNVIRVTDIDGGTHDFIVRNGQQGESFQPIEDVSGLTLAHVTGQNSTIAMSQKGVTDALNSNLVMEVLAADTYDIAASTQSRNLLAARLEVGKTYIFEATLGSEAAAEVGVNLYYSSSTSNNTRTAIGTIPQGQSSGFFEYTPSAETNYQYLGFWSTVANTITISYREKIDVAEMKDELDIVKAKAVVSTIGSGDVTWERGNIDSSTGANKNSTATVRTVGYSRVSADFEATNNTGYIMTIYFYDDLDYTFIGGISVRTTQKFTLSELTNNDAVRFRIIFYNPAAVIPVEDAATFDWNISTITEWGKELNEVWDYLTPNTYGNNDVAWVQGNIDSTTGENKASTMLVRTYGYITISDDFELTNNSSYFCFLHFYETDGTYIGIQVPLIGSRKYKLSGITNGESVNVRIVFYNTQAQITTDEAATLDWNIRTLTEFEQELPMSSMRDYSDVEKIELPIPYTLPKVNIQALNLPIHKGDDVSAYLEYTHDNVHFIKPIILNPQGSSSMWYYQKNLAIDLDDGSEIKFGNWVSQDSFHLKCYYIDVLKGYNNITYNYVEEVIRYKNCRANRNIGTTTIYNGTGTFARDFDCALCHPDGFPFELYVNGSYYGLYVWNLKKHRDNYSMKKNNYSQVHLDGEIGDANFFNGTISWSSFEIRNPKTLITINGEEYDGDSPVEIIDENSEYYDSTNADMVNTAITKAAIVRLANAKAAINAEETTAAKRAKFEEYFDVEMMTVYLVMCNVVDDHDAFYKNWQWTCYNGIWAPNFYDMDSLFGRHFTGSYIFRDGNSSFYLEAGSSLMGLFYSLYETEIKALYTELRDNGIISVPHYMEYVHAWVNRIGQAAYKRNIDKWPQIPSYREDYPETPYTDGTAHFSKANRGMYDSPARIRKWLNVHIAYLDNLLGYNS